MSSADRHRVDAFGFDYPELALGWRLKEDFRAIYELCDTRDSAEEAFEWWLGQAAASAIPEFVRLATNLRPWRNEILNYFTYRVTNGFSEGITNRIKVLKRQGYGIPNFASFRRRILVECGNPRARVPA